VPPCISNIFERLVGVERCSVGIEGQFGNGRGGGEFRGSDGVVSSLADEGGRETGEESLKVVQLGVGGGEGDEVFPASEKRLVVEDRRMGRRNEPRLNPSTPELALNTTLDDGALRLHKGEEARREADLVNVENELVLPRLAEGRRRLDSVPEGAEV
jgi:hypothetical protein